MVMHATPVHRMTKRFRINKRKNANSQTPKERNVPKKLTQRFKKKATLHTDLFDSSMNPDDNLGMQSDINNADEEDFIPLDKEYDKYVQQKMLQAK